MVKISFARGFGAIALAGAAAMAVAAPAGAATARPAMGEDCAYTVTVSPTLIYASYLTMKIVGETYKGDAFIPGSLREELGYIYGSSNGYTGYVLTSDLTPAVCTG